MIPKLLKVIFTFEGEKNSGKTTLAMSLPGKMLVLSLDNKAFPVWMELYASTPRIKVVDASRHLDYVNINQHTLSAVKTLETIEKTLNKSIHKGYDWVLWDGSDELIKILEMVMRNKERVGVYQGVQNRGAWNLRNWNLRSLYHKSLGVAKIGVAFTTFREIVEFTDDNGETKQEYRPKWSDVIKGETDIHIRTSMKTIRERGKIRQVFTALVVGSKRPSILRTGEEFEMGHSSAEGQKIFGIDKYLSKTGRMHLVLSKSTRPKKKVKL